MQAYVWNNALQLARWISRLSLLWPSLSTFEKTLCHPVWFINH